MDNSISAAASENDRLLNLEQENKRLRRSVEELSVLNELASAIGGLGSTQSILSAIVEHSIKAVGAGQGVITLIEEQDWDRRKTMVRMADNTGQGTAFHLHQSILGWMYRNKIPLLINDTADDPRFPGIRFDPGIRTLLCAPLMIKGEITGVLTVYNKHEQTGFTPDDPRLLFIMAAQSAQVIENARLSEREQQHRQELSHKLIASQEQERKRIAAELHDSVGQNLLVIKNRASLAMNACGEEHPAAHHLQSISTVAMQTVQEVREISYDLHPFKLERLGLTKSLQAIVSQMCQVTTVRCSADIAPIDNLLAKESEIHVYRIVQEGISNALRHARASQVILNIAKEPAALAITIRDDGCGFIVDDAGREARESSGFGLRGMAERARMCNGALSVQSCPGSGTTLVITIPYERNNSEQ